LVENVDAPGHLPTKGQLIGSIIAQSINSARPYTKRTNSIIGRLVKLCACEPPGGISAGSSQFCHAKVMHDSARKYRALWISLLINLLLRDPRCGILILTRFVRQRTYGLRGFGLAASGNATWSRFPGTARELWEDRFSGPSAGRNGLQGDAGACHLLTLGVRPAGVLS
jgi:hypothetical protein